MGTDAEATLLPPGDLALCSPPSPPLAPPFSTVGAPLLLLFLLLLGPPSPSLPAAATGGSSLVAASDAAIRGMSRQFLRSPSRVDSYPGRSPPRFCKLTNVFLPSGDTTFYMGFSDLARLEDCDGVARVWNVRPKGDAPVDSSTFRCDQIYDRGYAFPVLTGDPADRFRLHYDTIIPLFVALHYRQYAALYGRQQQQQQQQPPADLPHFNVPPSDPRHTVLLPGVHSGRGQPVDWSTDRFFNLSSYWMDAITTVGLPYPSLPLDQRLIAMKKTMCFKEIFFGTPRADYANTSVVRSFISFAKDRLGIQESATPVHAGTPTVGLLLEDEENNTINFRRLRNSSMSVDIVKVDSEYQSFAEQAIRMQNVSVLIGKRRDALISGLYLPSESIIVEVTSELECHECKEFRELLESRGAYLVWNATAAGGDLVPPSGNATHPPPEFDESELQKVVQFTFRFLQRPDS